MLNNLIGRFLTAGLDRGFNTKTGSQNSGKGLRFPEEDEGNYKGKITFKAYKTESKGLPELFQGKIANYILPRQGRLVGVDQIEARRSAKAGPGLTTTTKNIPKQIGSGRVCTLYLPSSIQFQDRVEYTSTDLGILGATAARAIASDLSAGQIIKAVGGATLPNFESIQDAFTYGLKSEAAQVASLRVAQRLSGPVAGAVETTTGIALNPNRRSTLKGVGLRQFRFAFKMIPISQSEADTIKAIVKFFREEMYPEARFISNVSAAYRFPSKFDIRMTYDDKQVATGILPCFLESIDVVYNPNSMAFHTDGNPQETDISLNFIEERTLDKYDVAVDGY
jgi:hypothetical protein